MSLFSKLVAEFLGTFWLVFAGIGTAVLAAEFPNAAGDPHLNPFGVGFLGVGLAVGLTVMTGAYAVGHISGAHFNPAVSIGLLVGGRFSAGQLLPYIAAQVLGGIAGGGILYLIATGNGHTIGDFASNGYGKEHSPGQFSLASCFLAEFMLTAFFLFIIHGSTDRRAPAGFAPIAIGLGLTLIHLVGIPVTNLSVNPARSTATAVYAQGWTLSQLWLFWVAPILGGIVGGIVYRIVDGGRG